MPNKLKIIKKEQTIVICVMIMLLFETGSYWVKNQKERTRAVQCLSTLRATGCTLKMYRDANNSELPPRFSLLKRLFKDPRLLICPLEHKEPEDWINVTEWMDYIYLYRPSIKGPYAYYPLMYDRRMANHNGKGICILLVDGSVRPHTTYHGQFFWDEGAQWLQKFARNHPECNIPLPEDLNKK